MENKQYFSDKVVLITGASAGIGEAAAKRFAELGAKLVLADINPRGAEVADAVVANGGVANFVECDVSSSDSVEKLFDYIKTSYGRLDMAFNNAGIDIETTKLGDTTGDVYDKIMDINVKGVWLCMQHELNMMAEQGAGAIVNTSSIAGLGAAPKMGVYAASKHAVIGLTKSAAVEYARKGVRVNAVCPAVIDTDMYRRAIDGDPKKAVAIGSLHPVGRVGQPEEVVNAVVYLCSEHGGFTTGVALPVDGGSTAI